MNAPPDHAYDIGYGKPPIHSRFVKGQSGNPGGRPAGRAGGSVKEMAFAEAHRMVTVTEGDRAVELPAIQAIFRSQIALATKGDGLAQRAVIAIVTAIETEIEQQVAAEQSRGRGVGFNDPRAVIDAARRISFILASGERAQAQLDAEAARNATAAPAAPAAADATAQAANAPPQETAQASAPAQRDVAERDALAARHAAAGRTFEADLDALAARDEQGRRDAEAIRAVTQRQDARARWDALRSGAVQPVPTMVQPAPSVPTGQPAAPPPTVPADTPAAPAASAPKRRFRQLAPDEGPDLVQRGRDREADRAARRHRRR